MVLFWSCVKCAYRVFIHILRLFHICQQPILVTRLFFEIFFLEVENFIDEDDCELLIDLAKAKSLKPIHGKFPDVQFKNAEETFKEWDLDQDGVITPSEVCRTSRSVFIEIINYKPLS